MDHLHVLCDLGNLIGIKKQQEHLAKIFEDEYRFL